MYNKKQNKTRHTLFIKNDASCFLKISCENTLVTTFKATSRYLANSTKKMCWLYYHFFLIVLVLPNQKYLWDHETKLITKTQQWQQCFFRDASSYFQSQKKTVNAETFWYLLLVQLHPLPSKFVQVQDSLWKKGMPMKYDNWSRLVLNKLCNFK